MRATIDEQIDAIFGGPKMQEACTDALGALAAVLASIGDATLWLIDANNRVLASWPPADTAVDSSCPPCFALPNTDTLCRQDGPHSAWLVNVALAREGVNFGRLAARIGTWEADAEPLLAQRIDLLRTVGALLLERMAQSDRLAEAEARLQQLTRQHDTFQEEHRRIVAMNLLERDARLAEQRTYTARLREEVQSRTRQLLERTVELEQSEARIRAIVDTAPDGIITIDLEGNIRSFNAAAARMFGYRRQEVLGHNVQMLIPAPKCDDEDPRLSRFVQSSPPIVAGHERHLEAKRKDGTVFPISLALSEVTAGPQHTITAIVRDITEQQQAEKSLREYARALENGTKALEEARFQSEAASRSKSEFLANMSHEIRTPMTAIMGHAELLRDPDQTDEERIGSAEAIYRNADHLLQLINDILDLSKIEAGKLRIERIDCSPCQVIAEVASMMRARAHEKKLALRVDYPGLVPQAIQSDPTRLRQILVNLVGNAIKFTNEGEIRITCSLLDPPDAANPRTRIDVTDTGIGIAGDRLARIFEPFVQADNSTTRLFGGTGLGLAISRRLARALGGDIAVKSKLGRGSTFTLTVVTGPLDGIQLLDRPKEAELEQAIQFKQLPARRADAASLAGRRILLAEDGRDNQKLISHYLKKAGAEVVIAENGKAAVKQALSAAARPFDLIFMDMQMPVVDGYTATARLRAENYMGPIVALTAHAMVGDREKCLEAGCDDYMTKPIDRNSLIQLAARHAAAGARDTAVSAVSTPEPPCRAEAVTERQGEGKALVSQFADDPSMTEIIDRFLARLPDRLEEIDAAMQTGDRQRLGRIAHQLKGAAGGYGFPIITEQAAEVEQLARHDRDEASLQTAIERLRSLCRRAQASPNCQTRGDFVEAN